MGRDGAYKGVYCQSVFEEFDNIVKQKKHRRSLVWIGKRIKFERFRRT